MAMGLSEISCFKESLILFRRSKALLRHNGDCGRVSSDLENVEMSGNFDARSSLGKVMEFFKIGKIREFCCLKSIFSQSEHPNFQNFLRQRAPDPPKQPWIHIRI